MHLSYWQFWAIISPLALAVGIISSAIMVRILREPPASIRGCDDCGSRLFDTDGTNCAHCVALRRSVLQAEGARAKGLTP